MEVGEVVQSTSINTQRRYQESTIFPKISVVQVCKSVGFQSFQQSALNTLSDVAARCIRELGKNASFCKNLAGRTESNVFDIVQELEDLGSSHVFLGASDINGSLSGSAFKFGIGKKSSGTSVSLRNEGIDKITSRFKDNNEKDDKKSRAEQILKESMENPQELVQL
ncbi:unnamed protein product [Camellia sinensis]